MNPETNDLLAVLLAYPSDETKVAMDRCRTRLRLESPGAGTALDRFAEQTSSMTTEALQELYTQTFDLNPACSLEVGWQLYGENYSRGEFLVAMRQTLRRLGVMETTELPDHLTHVLAALGRMENEEVNRFSEEFLLPALEKMRQGLSGKQNAYANVLDAIYLEIGKRMPAGQYQSTTRRELPIVSTTGVSLPTDSWQIPTEEEVCHG